MSSLQSIRPAAVFESFAAQLARDTWGAHDANLPLFPGMSFFSNSTRAPQLSLLCVSVLFVLTARSDKWSEDVKSNRD